MFNHGNVPVPEPVDRVLRRIVVTPNMHGVHHSMNGMEGNSNFAMLLPYWDHLFATYRHQPLLGRESMALGIAEAPAPGDVTLLRLLALPFRPVGAAGMAEESQAVTS